ncbi:hypothetical protein B0H11DRAFT_2237537 [Mycena galericulata]|nr:hypothetical protein B0H11DRAFT_2237537 [Mycena galericulata]
MSDKMAAANGKPDTNEERHAALPTELWILVLYMYCGGFDASPQQYNASREELRKKNSGWRRMIDSDSLFWCRVAINAQTSLREVRGHVAHIALREMDISLDFNVYTNLSHTTTLQCNPNRPRFRHAKALLTALAPTSHLWHQVAMVASCMAYVKIIVDIINGLPAPSLVYFSFHCHTYTPAEHLHPLFTAPLTIFKGMTPRLSHLRIVNAPLPHGGYGMFGSLTELEITNVPEIRWPTASAFTSILKVAKLTRMAFENFGVRNDPTGLIPLRSFPLPYLARLELVNSTGTDSILAALRGASTPSLKYLFLHAFNGDQYSALTHSLRDLQMVENLVVRARSATTPSREQTRLLLRGVPNLLQLDVSFDGQQFVDALASDSNIVPYLRILAVGGTRLSTLHTYVMKRINHRYGSPGLTVFFVTDYIPEAENAETKAAWIAEMRTKLHALYTYSIT